jgi:hypothetical protein
MQNVAFMKSFLLTIVMFIDIPTSHAWGKEGHEIVANIAYNLLTSEAKEASYHILFPSDDFNATGYISPLAAVANWADKARYTKEFSWTTPLHYVDVQDELIEGGCPYTPEELPHLKKAMKSKCTFQYERDCVDDFCAVGAIASCSHLSKHDHKSLLTQGRLRGPVKPYAAYNVTQRQSLMFLIHIIGDIHQPLHASRASDRGGNTIHVTFGDELIGHEGWNLQ